MSSTTDLAQELVDIILDFLHDDRGSLLSSSLVAWKWVPATRYHIFERVAISHFFTGHQGRHQFRDTAHEFLSICGSPHCTILPSIQNVVLNIDTEFNPAPGLLEQVVDELARAPIAKLLFIDHTSVPDPLSLSWIAPRFPGLRELAYNALDHVVEDVFALVASFPLLHSLAVYSTSRGLSTEKIVKRELTAAPPPSAFAHLNTLRLRLFSQQADELLSWLHNAGPQPHLQTLDVVVFHAFHNGWGPVAALNAVLRATGDHLRHFSLRITYEEGDDEIDEEAFRLAKQSDGEVDLSPLRNLRTLHLGSHNAETICITLASLPSRMEHLEALQTDFTEWAYYELLPCACNPNLLVEEFAGVMSEDRFAQLATFDIRVPDFFGDTGCDFLREYFPRWKDSDVLRIGFTDRDYHQVDSWET
ncbi:hypothetical protein C8R43DRAFT_1112965, partial [Mycena crocata]